MNHNYEINKIYQDDFGRVSGIFVVDKSEGKMSHDVVYEYRRKFNTKKVGHAGTLDPFASGLLIILVGKATKLSEQFLTMDKEYIAEIALGISTDTLDPEGNIVKVDDKTQSLDKKEIEKALKSFMPEYDQFVPIFSSVKVQGNKLREIARKSDRYEIIDSEKNHTVKFYKNEKIFKEIPLPQKNVRIYEIELLGLASKPVNELHLDIKLLEQLNSLEVRQLECLTIRVRCSKGTYIRKLAEDIGANLNRPAMLIKLRRTKVGEIIL